MWINNPRGTRVSSSIEHTNINAEEEETRRWRRRRTSRRRPTTRTNPISVKHISIIDLRYSSQSPSSHTIWTKPTHTHTHTHKDMNDLKEKAKEERWNWTRFERLQMVLFGSSLVAKARVPHVSFFFHIRLPQLGNRGLEIEFLHWTWVSEPQDASLQNSFTNLTSN